jgi:hypothetical protein
MTKAVEVELALPPPREVEVEIRMRAPTVAESGERPSIPKRAEGVELAPKDKRPPRVNWRAVEVAVPPEEEAMVKRGMV